MPAVSMMRTGGAIPYPPIITTASLPNGTQNTPYSVQLTAIAGVGALTWVLVSDSGSTLSLSPSGVFSGTPSVSGTFSIQVLVRDSLSVPSAPQNFSLTLAASGTLTVYHGQAVTISTAGLGAKSHNATILFDQGQDGVGGLNSGYTAAGSIGSGGSFTGADAVYNAKNRAPGVQVSGSTILSAHQYNTAFWSSTCAYNPPGAGGSGATAGVTVGYTKQPFPQYSYICVYYRVDPAFQFNLQASGGDFGSSGVPDNNWKDWTYTDGSLSVFTGNVYYYGGSNGAPPGSGFGGNGVFQDNTTTNWDYNMAQISGLVQIPDQNGHSNFWPSGSDPTPHKLMFNPCVPANGWIKREIRVKLATDNSGWILITENGVPVVRYQGQTAYVSASTVVNESWLCTYTRNYGQSTATGNPTKSAAGYYLTAPGPASTNAVYAADNMYDRDGSSDTQLVLTDQATYASSTYRETWPYTDWVNGKFVANVANVPLGTAYLWATNVVLVAGVPTVQATLKSQVTVVAQPQAFDYYISPTGDDNNAGTLVSPWSITALNASAKRTLYAGKRVGLMPGTYTQGTVGGVNTSLYSLFGTISAGPNNVINIQGGTSSASTFIGACTSSGVYSPPVAGTGCSAIIDSSQPGSGGTVVPVASGLNTAGIIGQSQAGTNASTVQGYVTIAGIYVKYFAFAGISFNAPSSPSIPGILVQDCELAFGNNVSSGNNPGAIFFYKFPQSARVTNCKIHDLTTITGGGVFPWGQAGVMVNQDSGTTEGSSGRVDHCTMYKVGLGFAGKNNYSNWQIDHNYIESGNLGIYSGTASAFAPCSIYATMIAPGNSVVYSYNVIVGGIVLHPEDGTANQGGITASNNTFYCGPGGNSSTAAQWAFTFNKQGATGSGNFNHNVVYLASGYNTSLDPYGTVGCNALGAGFTCDQNYYGTGCTFGSPGHSDVNLTTWKTLGFDPNSSTISGSPFVTTPVSNNLQSFVATATYRTAQDSTPCGALNASGTAADGSGIVGCNF